MKNNIFRFAAIAFAAMVMCVVPSCEDPIEEPGPDNSQTNNNNNENTGNNENDQEAAANFPELVENYEVAPGSELIVKFTPNYNWQLSVPSEVFKYFWILDNGFKVEKLSGVASDKEVSVKIVVSEEEEFDTNRSCDVTLTMNNESKVVAKFMRPAKNRTLAAYAVQLDDEGNLAVGEDGKTYLYATDEASSVALVWSESDADFRLPVKVDANCEWQVEVPEWLDVEVPEKTTGVVELLFKGVSLTEQTGKITFKAGEQVLKELDVTIPSCAGVDVYAAKYSDGEFEYGEDGYMFESAPASELSLVWLGSDFRLPVQVSAKCEWTLEMPEWITANLPDKTSGSVNFTLLGVPSKYPLEDTEGKIKFIFEDKSIHEITVKIPGCKDIMFFSIDMSLTEFNYNAAGWLNTTSGYMNMKATGSVFGTKDVKVFAVETTGGVVGAAPSWFNVTLANYVTASGSDVLQERDVTFDVQPNEGDNERSAIVFFLSPSMSDKVSDLFNEDATVKEDYIKHSVKVHQMSSVYEDYLEISSVEDMTEYTFDKKSDVDEIIDIFGDTDQVYALNYTAEYSKVWVNLAVAYHSYKVFSSSFSDKTADESFWLKFDASESKIYGAFTMYMEQELPEEPSTGYVVFYDSKKNVLAIVECISPCKEKEEDEEVVTPPADDVEYITDAYGNVYVENTSYFSDPEAAAAAGIKMYELKEGHYYDRYKAHNTKNHSCALLILEYPSSDVEAELTLTCEVSNWSAYPMTWAYNEYVKVNNESYGTSSGTLELSTNKITIQMSEFIAENMDLVESITNDKDAGFPVLLNNAQDQDPEFVIYCRIRVTK